ncbi:MAG: TolC family protein, partial [Caulobacteraceae bacterium]
LDARLDVVERTLAARLEALRIEKRRADTGYSPVLELRQAEAEYHAAAELIPATRLAIRRQEDGLSLLLGRNPGAVARGLELDALNLPPVPAGLPASLLRRRPDIAAAEQQMVAADRTLDSVRAAFMPDLQLSGQGGAVVSSLIEQNPTGIYTVEAGILGPIFDAGRLRAQQRGAAAQRNEAAYNYRRTALTAFKEVEDGLAAVQRSAEQEASLAQEREALAATLRLATRRYRSGYSPYLEQVDAERALLSAELSLVQSRADRLNAAVSLYEALGGGWTS